ncbi:RDD family protein [Sandaracinus amylolyticus]|uniref:RDD domain-containing protein n=1 Tax=Sandaracinus amylolyticus TaxID=927083 RepID=A0A0F6SHU9_9BACT|nr:RDD family protein [Sandaracinus amylolyticus]AKF11074.1 hypothetical protein DB32_008223 [Sandaracinus amylolyticus]
MSDEAEPAGIVSRFAAFVIDLALVGAGSSAAAWFVDVTGSMLLPSSSWTREVTSALAGASCATIAAVYFVGLWAIAGRTAGLLLLGLRVVPANGGARLPFARALLRFVGCILAALPLYLGFVWILFDPDRRGWHDRIAGTRVVYDPPLAARGRRVLRPPRGASVA